MNELTKIDTIMQDSKELAALKQICAPNSNEQEYKLLLEMCKGMNLNPYLKEIYQIKIGGKAQTFISRDGYRVVSQRDKNYDYHYTGAFYSNDVFKVINGMVHHEYGNEARGTLLGAYCVVKKHSSSREISVVVRLDEFNKKQSNWLSMPEVMICKVAEASALRMAFASEFVGTYHESEQWDEPAKMRLVNPRPVVQEIPKVVKINALEQKENMMSLIEEVALPEDRMEKAMKYYGVSSYAELNYDDSEHFLKMLRAIKKERQEEQEEQ